MEKFSCVKCFTLDSSKAKFSWFKLPTKLLSLSQFATTDLTGRRTHTCLSRSALLCRSLYVTIFYCSNYSLWQNVSEFNFRACGNPQKFNTMKISVYDKAQNIWCFWWLLAKIWVGQKKNLGWPEKKFAKKILASLQYCYGSKHLLWATCTI